MKNFITMLILGVVFLGFVWGCFWIAKKTSYVFFYEDFVKQTIKETVKPEYLK